MSTDRLVQSAGLNLARRFSRRSLLGRAGVAVGALGASAYYTLADPPPAAAYHCGHSLSATCSALGFNNQCPSAACKNGWWSVSGGPCGDTTYWQDCCASQSSSACHGAGCHCHSDGSSCCHSCYPSGGGYCDNCCGVVVCRRWFC